MRIQGVPDCSPFDLSTRAGLLTASGYIHSLPKVDVEIVVLYRRLTWLEEERRTSPNPEYSVLPVVSHVNTKRTQKGPTQLQNSRVPSSANSADTSKPLKDAVFTILALFTLAGVGAVDAR